MKQRGRADLRRGDARAVSRSIIVLLALMGMASFVLLAGGCAKARKADVQPAEESSGQESATEAEAPSEDTKEGGSTEPKKSDEQRAGVERSQIAEAFSDKFTFSEGDLDNGLQTYLGVSGEDSITIYGRGEKISRGEMSAVAGDRLSEAKTQIQAFAGLFGDDTGRWVVKRLVDVECGPEMAIGSAELGNGSVTLECTVDPNHRRPLLRFVFEDTSF